MRTTKMLLAQTSLYLVTAALLMGPAYGQTCASDSDCGQGMVCHSQTMTTCSGAGCAKGVECDAVALCATSTVNACTYRALLPCSSDTDCGSGFTCQPTVVESCSASAPNPSSGDSAGASTGGISGSASVALPSPVDAPVGGTCTTSTSYPGYCQLTTATCASDADCPAPYSCLDSPTSVTVGVATPVQAPVALDGSAIAPTPEPIPATAVDGGAPLPPSPGKTCQLPMRDAGASGAPESADAGTLPGNLVLPLSAPAPVDAGAPAVTTPTLTPGPSTGASGNVEDAGLPASQSVAANGGGCAIASRGLHHQAVVLVGLGMAIAVLLRRRSGTR
ncbi:MAG: hypothetical protein ABSB49_03340 [Polyangia bacterium]